MEDKIIFNYNNKKYSYTKKELAELKQKVIVPKYNCNQEIFFIDEQNQDWCKILKATILAYDYYDKRYFVQLVLFNKEQIWLYEQDIFATKEEAEKKLAEIKGEKL